MEQQLFSGGKLMSYKRRMSQIIADARQRSGNLKTIDPALDLGGGLNVAAFDAMITTAQASLDAYNALLAQADASGNNFGEDEKDVRTMSARMLAGVGAHYGKDSNQYEMAGGTRTSDIDYHPSTPPEEEGGGGNP
jgi:hypothetical protein